MVFQTLRFLFNPTFSATENGDSGQNAMSANKSSLKDFLASIATMTGDLSNITAPPFVLDTKSVVEIPAFWAENPSLFVSPALSDDPAERAILVLKSFLAGMKSQCYMGHTEEEGLKKPLNAFLGEIFLGHWDDEKLGTTYLVSEQVSHHPPITACRVWNPEHGVIAEGYNRQRVTFSWSSMSVNVGSTGFALKTLEKYNEHYLLPLPDFKVKGVLSGAPYPEMDGEYYLPCTSGYMSKIDFSGKGILGGGKKHGFTAVMYKEEDGPKKPLYTIEGHWNTEFTIRDEKSGKIIETLDVNKQTKELPELQIPPVEDMDPWESRRAWHDTQEAIRNNDFGGVNAAKSFLEQGQRNMRKDEEKNGTEWQQLFFKSHKSHDVVATLMAKIPGGDFDETIHSTKGVWLFDQTAYERAEMPFRPGLVPDNLKEGEERVYRNGSRSSLQLDSPPLPRGSIDSRSSTPRGSIDSRASTPRGSIDEGSPLPRRSMDGRNSIDSARPRVSSSLKQTESVDEKIGAVEDGRPAEVNGTLVDVGRQPVKKEINGITKDEPAPQTAQLRSKEEELGSGVEGLNLKEKIAVEDMLRDTYASSAS